MKIFQSRSVFGLLVFGACSLLAACGESSTESSSIADYVQPVQSETLVEVWKTSTCGCCSEWVEHLKQNGFNVQVNNVDSTESFRAALGMPQVFGSCHSAKAGGYAFEGHVPAADIKKLLAEKPDAVGLSVPGMPLGSPGMEHADHPGKRAAYDVLLVTKNGGFSSYTHYDAVN